MTVLLTLLTAIAAGWIIDRLAFNGDLTGMIRDEIGMARARLKPPSGSPRPARRR